MARIPAEELERIKRETALEALVVARGVELVRRGADLVGLCPFHDDHEPSLVVSPAKHLWHCLGACQAGGSVIDWVMRSEGVSFRHAVEILRTGIVVAGEGPAPRQSRSRRLASPLDPEVSDGELLRQVVDYYAVTLRESYVPRDYLRSRGLDDGAAVERFSLGYADRTLGLRIPRAAVKEGALLRGRLEGLRIIRESGHEHFNGSLVVPVFDEAGEVAEIYGRKVTPRLRAGTPQHLYLKGQHRGVWNAAALGTDVILCEALLDALTFWVHGFTSVTASYGVNGFTAEHLEVLQRRGTKRVLVAYDRDEAGDRGSAEVAERLLGAGIGCYRVLFPRGMDANAYASKMSPAEKALDLVVRNATWLGNGRPPSVGAAGSRPGGVEAAEDAGVDVPDQVAGVGDDAGAGDASRAEVAQAGALAAFPLAAEPPAPAVETEERAVPVGLSASGGAVVTGEIAGPAAAPLRSPRPTVQPSSPTPPPPSPDGVTCTASGEDEVTLRTGDRVYRVRGLAKNASFGVLRVNLLVRREGVDFADSPLSGFFVDSLDVYAARQRASFEKQAAAELGVREETIRRDLGTVLGRLEALQEEALRRAPAAPKVPSMSETERAEALALLADPRLLERIGEDLERCGLVGESGNRLLAYLAATSRKLAKPLAVIVQSSSAAGKSSLMDAVLALMPEEETETFTALSGQSLFYFDGEKDLRHKILAIAEEEGAARATYALKTLQSEGSLAIASTGKDEKSGRLVTREYRVEGPVMLFLTTTAIDLDEELANRCLVLAVDESRAQTRRIQERQRFAETLAGVLAERERPAILRRYRNAQRLLRPVIVVNEHASSLGFADEHTRMRRDNKKYLTLIRTVAYLHQYQRSLRRVVVGGEELEVLDVTAEDVAIANRLAAEAFGRTLDELPPQTRRLLHELEQLVEADAVRLATPRGELRLTQREIRERLGWGATQLKLHLGRLEVLEYVVAHRQGARFLYELAYAGEGRNGERFVLGLLAPEQYDAERSGVNGAWSARGRGLVGGQSAAGRGEQNGAKPFRNGAHVTIEPNGGRPAQYRPKAPESSYPIES